MARRSLLNCKLARHSPCCRGTHWTNEIFSEAHNLDKEETLRVLREMCVPCGTDADDVISASAQGAFSCDDSCNCPCHDAPPLDVDRDASAAKSGVLYSFLQNDPEVVVDGSSYARWNDILRVVSEGHVFNPHHVRRVEKATLSSVREVNASKAGCEFSVPFSAFHFQGSNVEHEMLFASSLSPLSILAKDVTDDGTESSYLFPLKSVETMSITHINSEATKRGYVYFLLHMAAHLNTPKSVPPFGAFLDADSSEQRRVAERVKQFGRRAKKDVDFSPFIKNFLQPTRSTLNGYREDGRRQDRLLSIASKYEGDATSVHGCGTTPRCSETEERRVIVRDAAHVLCLQKRLMDEKEESDRLRRRCKLLRMRARVARVEGKVYLDEARIAMKRQRYVEEERTGAC